MKKIAADELGGTFMNACVFNYGPPEEPISDNAGCFTSKFFIDLCNLMSIKNF